MKNGLEQRIDAEITIEWSIIEWMPELAIVQMDRCIIGKDEKTAYARREKSNEHIVIIENEGPAIRCRTIKIRPEGDRWQARRVKEMSNPKATKSERAWRSNIEDRE